LGGSLDVVPGTGAGDRQLADASVDDLGLAVALGGEGLKGGKLRPNWLMIVVAISWLLISVPPLLTY
jgi:hypothetical protein